MERASRLRFSGTIFLIRRTGILFSSLLVATRALSVLPVPSGKNYLPFQRESIESLARSNRILLADEMGCGKTISTIGALNLLLWKDGNPSDSAPNRVLILCPKSVIPSWEFELKRWLAIDPHEWALHIVTAEKGLPVINVSSPDTRLDVLLMNYDIVEKRRNELDMLWAPFDVLVCDEAHYLKNPSAIRTKAVLGGLEVGDRKPLRTQRLWFLTGSPLLNHPCELFRLLRSIDPEFNIIPELHSFDAFSSHYSHRREAPWGITYRGGKNLPELRERLRMRREDGTPLMIRRTKAQVLKDLPPKQHQLVPLWDNEQRVASEERQRVQLALQEITARIQQREQSTLRKALDESSVSCDGLENKTVVELKALLKENNLKVSGKKKELIDRLNQRFLLVDHSIAEAETPPISQERNLTAESLDNVFSSAQSALRSSRGRTSGSDVIQDMLGLLQRTGLNTTKSDSDTIRGLIAAARHETARLKVPHAIELIKNAIAAHKVVVFAFHRDIQTELKEAFGSQAVGIMGGDPLEQRADAVQRFQMDPSVRVFVGSIRAAGTGITLSAASHVVFVELDWSPLVVQQAEDRCHRVGQKSSVLVQYLYFPDTIDEYLSEVLASKQSTITSAIDDATGSVGWVFDFGKHTGLCVADVAGTDPSYLEWLVESKTMLENRPVLTTALVELGFRANEILVGPKKKSLRNHSRDENDPPIETTVPKVTKSGSQGIRSNPGSYTITFGKYKGKRLEEIPTGYLNWLRRSGATRRIPMMAICLNKHLAERRSSVSKLMET